MKETGILFSAPMIPPILDGRKTQTRRLVTARHPLTHIGPKGSEDSPDEWGYFFDGPESHGYMVLGQGHNDSHDNGLVSIPCPYGEPGDRLWVRESWGLHAYGDYTDWFRGSVRNMSEDDVRLQFALAHRADWGPLQDGCFWRPGIFMPRWASRITLEVVDIRVQRLQDISEDDARAEGCSGTDPEPVAEGGTIYAWHGRSSMPCPRAHFATRWDDLNGKRRRREYLQVGDPGYTVDRPWRTVVDTSASWEANPWVRAITFRRITP